MYTLTIFPSLVMRNSKIQSEKRLNTLVQICVITTKKIKFKGNEIRMYWYWTLCTKTKGGSITIDLYQSWPNNIIFI